KAVDYGTLPIDRGDRSNVWVRDGDDLIAVGQVRGKGKAVVLGDVTIYDRAGSNLVAITTAPRGRYVGKGWQIGPATRFDVATARQ
ncbi:hypothetical protein, partial [Clostridium perfringens]